jgi:hypothetical protein
MFLRRLFRQKCQVTMTLHTVCLVDFHSRWMKCWFYSWKRKWIAYQHFMLSSKCVVFWRMFCILSNHLNLQYVYCPCVVLAKDIANQNVIWLLAGLDKSKVIMAPRNFLLESSIFQGSSSSDPFFFPENPHLTVTVPQNCTTLDHGQSEHQKLVFSGHSWSVELSWKVNRHISLHCHYIAWSCLCALNTKSKPVSTVDFLTLQKNCLAPVQWNYFVISQIKIHML